MMIRCLDYRKDRSQYLSPGLNLGCLHTNTMLDSAKYDPHSPKKVEDLVGNTDVWKSTADLIRGNNASHTVLVGPSGCGKSLFIRIVLATFPTLHVDCTANFGLRDVRDTIRTFAKGSRADPNKMRWIVFSRADSLTSDTQAFLRRMLETTSANTRILFECRDAGAISEPIYSRSTLVLVNAPDVTDMTYEIQRRTNYALDRAVVAHILKHAHGNMRMALLHALAALYCDMPHDSNLEEILRARPSLSLSLSPSSKWVEWASYAEQTCKLNGLDLRDVLRIGWPNNPVVANTCAQWSRLGGTSTRALFFDCVSHIVPSC